MAAVSAVRLEHATIANDEGRPSIAVQAIDLRTHQPVAAMRLRDMAAWLSANGYRYATGTSGIWSK